MLLFLSPIYFLAASSPFLSLAIQLSWRWNGHSLSPKENHVSGRATRRAFEEVEGQPFGVRKMTLDEGEMFFPQYWNLQPSIKSDFELGKTTLATYGQHAVASLVTDERWEDRLNATMSRPVQAPFALHEIREASMQSQYHSFLRFPRDLFALSKREFVCPGGTYACTNINSPATCCPTGQRCQSIGSGGVGCCIEGQTCSQDVAACGEGYTSCLDSPGGGCCVPGYSCVAAGCEVQSTATIIINPTITASPSSSTRSSTSVTDASTAVSTSTHTDTVSTTSTLTAPRSSVRSSTTSSAISSASPTSSRITSTPVPLPPVRPISGSASTSTTTTAPPTTITPSQCPTGFYACSAYYHGGCCRIGRDCSETSCPAASSSLALNSNGVSIGVPAATTGATLGVGGCALGWYGCGMEGGGGCCPSGYACGESCTATDVNVGGGVTGTAKVAKDNGVERVGIGKAAWIMILSVMSGMTVLMLIA